MLTLPSPQGEDLYGMAFDLVALSLGRGLGEGGNGGRRWPSMENPPPYFTVFQLPSGWRQAVPYIFSS